MEAIVTTAAAASAPPTSSTDESNKIAVSNAVSVHVITDPSLSLEDDTEYLVQLQRQVRPSGHEAHDATCTGPLPRVHSFRH
jgi:hypothetical protein